MKHHDLRTAWSAAWGIAAVLLIALWARSHYVADVVRFPIYQTMKAVVLHTAPAYVTFDTLDIVTRKRWAWYSVGQNKLSAPPLGFPVRYGICVLTTAVLALAPWHPRQFSLRTLLIATTLVALGLALVTWLG